MNNYAIVQLLPKQSPIWPEFRVRYEKHFRANGKASTLTNSIRPTMNSFEAFLDGEAIGEPPISSLTKEHADDWVSILRDRDELREASVRTRIAVMQSAFEWATSERMIGENIFRHLKLSKIPFAGRILSDVEIKLLFSALSEEVRNACTVYLYTGVRARELTSAQWWQVREDHVFIPSEKNKSERGRTILIGNQVKAALGRRRGDRDSVVSVNYNQIRYAIIQAALQCELGRIKIHDFRHTCVTRFFEESDDVLAACKIFGWANPASAEPYHHMTRKIQEKILRVSYPCLENAGAQPGLLPS